MPISDRSIAALLLAIAFVPEPFAAAPRNTLAIQLVHRCPPVASCLRPDVVRRMTREAEQIWSPLDVRIEWIDSLGSTAPARPVLTVMLEEQALPATQSDAVMASIAPPAAPCDGGLARVWVRNVRRQVAHAQVSGVPFENLPNALEDAILGRALGRALAHEIGHYLLGSAHTPYGLMRASMQPSEFVEVPSPGRYGLDASDRARLASCRTHAFANDW